MLSFRECTHSVPSVETHLFPQHGHLALGVAFHRLHAALQRTRHLVMQRQLSHVRREILRGFVDGVLHDDVDAGDGLVDVEQVTDARTFRQETVLVGRRCRDDAQEVLDGRL